MRCRKVRSKGIFGFSLNTIHFRRRKRVSAVSSADRGWCSAPRKPCIEDLRVRSLDGIVAGGQNNIERSWRSGGITEVREREHAIDPLSLRDGGWISWCSFEGVSLVKMRMGSSQSRIWGWKFVIRTEGSMVHGLPRLVEDPKLLLFASRL